MAEQELLFLSAGKSSSRRHWLLLVPSFLLLHFSRCLQLKGALADSVHANPGHACRKATPVLKTVFFQIFNSWSSFQ